MIPPPSFALPRVTGHRAAAGHAPENTLTAIRWAAAHGIPWVELDVCLSADGQPVVFHDDDVQRCTDGAGLVRTLPLSELRRLDAGSQFDLTCAGELIPTLDEALTLIGALGLHLNLELKLHHPTQHAALSDAVLAALTRHSALQRRVLLTAFDHALLRQLRALGYPGPIGMLFQRLPSNWRDALKMIRPVTVNVDYRSVNTVAIQSVIATGLGVQLYTVNTPAVIAHWLHNPAVGVISDYPDRFRHWIKQAAPA